MWTVWLVACTSPDLDADRDRDGVVASADCDDADPFVNPAALEVCDGRDNDCDGAVDDADADVVPRRWFSDPDGDGYGADDADAVAQCEAPAPTGWALQRGDCAPSDPTVHPDQLDGCDGRDEDCDGSIDEDPDLVRFTDNDGDGVGSAELVTCDVVATVAAGGDCDDADPEVAPGLPELCNGRDDDCDDLVDDQDPGVMPPTWFPDEDRDGVGQSGTVQLDRCVPPNDFWALVEGDCDDLDPTVFPGALERCDGIDSDCDGIGPDETAWADPDRAFRISGTVRAVVDTGPDAVVFVDVDFRQALDAIGSTDAFDPETLTAFVQDCAEVATPIGVSFTDGLADLLAPADSSDPLGDESGAVHLRFFDPLEAGQDVPIAVYFGGAPTIGTSPTVTATTVETAHLRMTIDLDRGALLDSLSVGGVNVLSQADAFDGNGVRVQGEWVRLAAPGASAQIVADRGGVGAIATTGSSDAPFATSAVWWTYTDLPVVFAKLQITPTLQLTGDNEADVRPFQSVGPGLSDPDVSVGDGWVGWRQGVGVQWGFQVPPAGGLTFACDGTDCFAAGGEAVGPVLAADARWLDHRVWFAVADDGTGAADASRVAGYLSPPQGLLTDAEARPGG